MTKYLLATCAAAIMAACGNEGMARGSETAPPVPASRTGAAAVQSAPTTSERREFGDWTAVCDNGNDCAAYAQVEDFGSGWVIVKLAAGPDARPDVRIGSGTDDGPFTITLDGAAVATEQAMVPVEGATPEAYGYRPNDVDRLVSALVQGQRLQLANPSDADEGGAIPLTGVAAAFLWIDERQGRLNTTTALIRKGQQPASAVPAPPTLPHIQAAAAASQDSLPDPASLPSNIRSLPAVETCFDDTEFMRRDGVADDQVHRLNAGALLWSIQCFQGAYNTGHRFFLSGPAGENPRPILLPHALPADSERPQEDLYVEINANYDPEDQTISSFSKGRGLGDCGAATTWTWTGEAFVLTQQAEMHDCAGMSADLWPTTYRSR